MTQEQKYLLQRLYLKPYTMSERDLNLLKEVLELELSLRQDVRNKELKVDLATKVEKETGNDQHIDELKKDLFLARKNYAKHLSDQDEYKYHGMPVPRDENNRIIGASDNLLEPIDEPHWEITTVEDDGTETVIGYS